MRSETSSSAVSDNRSRWPSLIVILLPSMFPPLPPPPPPPSSPPCPPPADKSRKWKKRETIHQFRPSREERKSTGTSYKHSIFPPPEIRLIITEYSSLTDPIPESTNILTTTNNSSFQITLNSNNNNNNNNNNINQCGCWQTFHLQLPDLCY